MYFQVIHSKYLKIRKNGGTLGRNKEVVSFEKDKIKKWFIFERVKAQLAVVCAIASGFYLAGGIYVYAYVRTADCF